MKNILRLIRTLFAAALLMAGAGCINNPAAPVTALADPFQAGKDSQQGNDPLPAVEEESAENDAATEIEDVDEDGDGDDADEDGEDADEDGEDGEDADGEDDDGETDVDGEEENESGTSSGNPTDPQMDGMGLKASNGSFVLSDAPAGGGSAAPAADGTPEEDDLDDETTEDDLDDESAEDESEEEITLDALPMAIVDAISQAVPGGTLVEAEVETEGGQVIYEVEVEAGGKVFEVEVAEDGTVLEVEEDDEDDD